MGSVGVLAHFEFTVGAEPLAAEFFRAGKLIVDDQPVTTAWFAFRIGPRTYGAFAAFATAADRESLLAAGGPRMATDNADMFIRPPSFELVDIVAARQAADLSGHDS